MDAQMINGQINAAQIAAWEEVINNQHMQIQQLLAANANNNQRVNRKPRPGPVSVNLPNFDRKDDVDVWIKKIEFILTGRGQPKDKWTSMVVPHLKDSAEAFWYNLISKLNVNEMSWATFTQDYINQFTRLSIKQPTNTMTDDDKKFLFTFNLPGHLRVKVLGNKCWQKVTIIAEVP
ncbi:hypothetical protein PTTG_01209 [Puccinia triticina 1-1 BBBD Race 1]|uniref:Retrotransposon gag domain-containing protein n=1 Tax=Puccinia triticina (isolate 1-1 / race 1 (BBBD)) TaxID=630390 RepID=A0A0C4EKD4_PUCT1|nr:hypothetical protein PTTG_01209 [Puccinia triticina 1-1 BBBD Race 1]